MHIITHDDVLNILFIIKYIKMKISFFLIAIALSISILSYGQTITGVVMANGAQNEMISLPGATVKWLNSNAGVVCDEHGNFEIEKTNDDQIFLLIRYVGYENDTVEINDKDFFNIMLQPVKELDEVIIKGESSASSINTSGPVNLETLNKKELLKAACCNLSESFETNASVDAEFSDAVTGARTIKLLGLDGVYSQIMVENMPNVRGLSSSYGLTFIPGPWVESIQITKGPGSVVNGYESITGSINTELTKPFDVDEQLFLINLYGSNSGRFEANVNAKHLFNENWSTELLTNTSQLHNKMDDNEDGFLDAPLNETFTLMNKWNYFSGKMHEAQFGAKYIYSNLTGGQINFDQDAERTTENGYGVNVLTNRVELFMKNGFVFKRPNTSIGTIVNYNYHDQHSYFGLNNYDGIENYINVNVIGQTYMFNTNHLIKAGASFMYDDFNEQYNKVSYTRTEQVPGIFTEYYFNAPDHWSVLAGARVDFHNLYGTFFSPRLHLKYTATPKTTLRMSAGKGYRTANVFAENTTLLTSNRDLIITEKLLPEEGWNYGLTFIQAFAIKKQDGSFVLDVYRTDFVNQIVVDVDSSVHAIYISNLHGQSFSNVLQAELNYGLFKNFDFKLAYKYIDAKETIGSELREVPLTSKNRGLINLAYKTNKEDWVFDFTSQYYGSARLPDLSGNPAATEIGNYSPDYVLLLMQITKKFKWFDLYAGSENLTNYTQKFPIIGYNDPFGENFDASVIYAPIMERKFYMGFRMVIN